MTDLEIARAAQPRALSEAAARIGIPADALEYYGKNKAKLPLELLQPGREKQANLVLVTAISPTPAGEGKTTVTVGLTDGLAHIGLKSAAALREPSLGPVFGIKGGATGGGHSQVIPMEDINLHFTGDFSAVEKANNLLAALIDNNLQSKKRSLRLDPRTISWKRVMDMNDRALRQIVLGLGGKNGGVPRESGFNITAASEIMAILCQSQSLEDLKERMGRIYVGDTWDREPVYASMLNAHDAMTLLMKDAIRPNLVQTLEGNPAILHGGPFANIAQGTNTLLATRMALSHADWVVTEAALGQTWARKNSCTSRPAPRACARGRPFWWPPCALCSTTAAVIWRQACRIWKNTRKTSFPWACRWWWPSTPLRKTTPQTTI